MRTLAIVPIKSLANAKQRLAKTLAGGSRRSLAQAMFSDVLGALRRTEGIDATAVVTDDAVAESLARGDRTVVLPDGRQAGQSQAAEVGLAYAREHGFDRALLAPGDTPLLDPVELEELLMRSARDEIEVAVVPDRHGTGTNALLLCPPDAIPPSFGPDSLARHVASARGAGVVCAVERIASLEHDVDTPEDLAALAARLRTGEPATAARTRAVLARIEPGRAEASAAEA